jgi:hypothetical protein
MECKKKLTIEDMYALAESRGGKCLSKEYAGVNKHLKWECQYGHQWEATPNSVKRGSWCPADAGKRVSRIV